MKSFIVALTLLVLTLALCITCNTYIGNEMSALEEAVHSARELIIAGGFLESDKLLTDVVEELDSKHRILCTMIDHDKITGLERSLQRAALFCRENSRALALGELVTLSLQIHKIKVDDNLTPANIL